MKRARSIISGLLTTIIMLALFTSAYAMVDAGASAGAEVAPVLTMTLRAASGAKITFKTQDGPRIGSTPLEARELPHLVLRRNGALTDRDERTLVVEVTGIAVPPPGTKVTLSIETQHPDPSPRDTSASGRTKEPRLSIIGRDLEERIPVWRETRWISNPSSRTRIGVTSVFTHTFGATVISGTRTIATPTDYFRLDVAVSDPSRSGVSGVVQEVAFLMENQWIAQLPEVREASPGAAPDQLIVYYLDMVPFQKDGRDPATWLARTEVPDYVRTELVPRMAEAFRVQTNEWGFTWYPEWTSYRRGEDARRLSVALSDGRTWFHGRAPLRAHSGISINVAAGDQAAYDTLTDGVISSFHHELFHNLQRNIQEHAGGSGDLGGKDNAWKLFSEGTAVLASSVGQPDVQFRWIGRGYMSMANGFIGFHGLVSDLNRSYQKMSPYRASIYWRFLFERCGHTEDGGLDPAAGMDIIRRALTILYAGDVVDITASTDLVAGMPRIMDRALSTSSCPFDTYAESLTAFSRAIYALRLEDGRCAAPGTPAGCGFYDPYRLYRDPPVDTLIYSGGTEQLAGDIPASFGIDFVEVLLSRAATGRQLILEFQGAPGTAAEFAVQVLALSAAGNGSGSRLLSAQEIDPTIVRTPEPARENPYVLPAIDAAEHKRLGLIITRVDANEGLDPSGGYTIALR